MQVSGESPALSVLLKPLPFPLLPAVPRLLFDGWSYQDYMTVLSSEDEIEELASELVDVAKVTKRRTQMP